MHKSLKLILGKINDIESIIDQNGSILKALEDRTLSKPAILMHLISIAEQFQRLQDALEYDVLSKFEKEDIRGAFAVRNFIAHDYEGVNLALIESVIRDRAVLKAKQQIKAASTQMALEAQALSDEQLAFEVDRLASEIIDKMPSDLWSDE